MKFLFAAAIALGFILPAVGAEDNDDQTNEPMAQLSYLSDCAGGELSLRQLHVQLAASAVVNHQSADSYKAMMRADETRLSLYLDVIKNILAPQIVNHDITKEDVLGNVSELVHRAMLQTSLALARPRGLAEQIALLQAMIERSAACERIANQVAQQHTL